jgi:ribosomal protein L18E
MNTYQDKKETVVEPVVVEPAQPTMTERATGLLHTVGEKFGLVSPIPDSSYYSKEPGLEQDTTFKTDRPTTINGAEYTHIHRVITETEPKPSLTERAKDYVYGAGEWIGLVANREDKYQTDQAFPKTWHEAAEHSGFSNRTSENAAHAKLTEAGQKVGIVEKPYSEQARDKLNEAGQEVGLVEKSYGEQARDLFYGAGQKVGLVDKPHSEQAHDKLTEAGQKVGLVEKSYSEQARDKLNEAGRKMGLVEKSSTEKVKDKLNEAKVDTHEAAELAYAEQKSFTERAKDYFYGVGHKPDVVSSHPELDNAKDKLYEARDKSIEAAREAGLVRQKSYPEVAKDKIREAGHKLGLVEEPVYPKPEFTDFTDLEGQTPFPVGITTEEIPKILPA